VAEEILTKRHIFYQHQELFGSQRRVDELVDCLALTLDTRRDNLNIVAASKGVIAGPLTIRLQDETVLDASIPDMVRAGLATELDELLLINKRAFQYP
jgi:meiotic recombination protein SPO11